MFYRYIECPVGISSKNQGVKPGEVVGGSQVRDVFVDNGCCHPAENNDWLLKIYEW